MSLFGKVFGKTPEAPKPPAAPSTAQPDPRNDPNMIRVFDKYGREFFITKEQWRTNVLPGTLKSNWNDPDQLYSVIFGALNDGLFADVLQAAEQLCRIDHDPSRGACVYGIVLMKTNRLDEADRVLRSHIAKHGENGVVLANLAKVYSARHEKQKAEETLWHALEVDPNQDNALLWFAVSERERGGEQAEVAAFRRVATLPKSWRAQLWLARAALKSRDLQQALAYYREGFSRAGKPAPADLLAQTSGDLGNAGHLPELLQLTEPCFVAEIHGLQAGNNLIKAHLDLGQLEAARKVLDQLYALKRPDWQQTLSYWDTEIAKAKVATTEVDQKAPITMAMLTSEGPVWLKRSSPAAELFPAKAVDAVVIAFLGSSAELASNSKRIRHQMSDAPGRMSRALPLFLAEQVEFHTHARVQTLVPWVTGQSGGFVLSGIPWRDEDAANHSRQGEIKSDYVVTIHLKTQAEPWTVELRLIRAIDGKCLEALSAAFPSARPQEGLPQLARQLLVLLARQAEVELQPPFRLYELPAAESLPYYLLRLEQLLAVRCGGMSGVNPGFLNGEREMIDGNLQLCLACPGNVGSRILLAQTLLAMNSVRPDILPEFKDKLVLLQKEHPLQEPAHGVVQRMLNEVLAV